MADKIIQVKVNNDKSKGYDNKANGKEKVDAENWQKSEFHRTCIVQKRQRLQLEANALIEISSNDAKDNDQDDDDNDDDDVHDDNEHKYLVDNDVYYNLVMTMLMSPIKRPPTTPICRTMILQWDLNLATCNFGDFG